MGENYEELKRKNRRREEGRCCRGKRRERRKSKEKRIVEGRKETEGREWSGEDRGKKRLEEILRIYDEMEGNKPRRREKSNRSGGVRSDKG